MGIYCSAKKVQKAVLYSVADIEYIVLQQNQSIRKQEATPSAFTSRQLICVRLQKNKN